MSGETRGKPEAGAAHEPDAESLLKANARFYEIFQELDYPAMEAFWEKSDRVFCVHPGWQALRGWRPVVESWKRIIANTASINFVLTQITAHVDGFLGVVTQYENISSRIGQERHTSGTVSTNIYAFDPDTGEWHIFHHHAAHAMVPDEEDGALLN
jgi:ketosteroid isomerase-like protein